MIDVKTSKDESSVLADLFGLRHNRLTVRRPLLLICSLLALACEPKGTPRSTTPGASAAAPPAPGSADGSVAPEPTLEPAPDPGGPTEVETAPAPAPAPEPEPEPNPNLLVFETPVTIDLVPPAAPTDGTRFVPLTDELPLRPIAKQLRMRGGMHRLGQEPIRKFQRPLPEGFEHEQRLRASGWWFPTPDAPVLVIPHFRSNRGQSVEAALLARPGAEGFVAVRIGGEKTASNYDCASTLVMSDDQTELGWFREMSYVDMDEGLEDLETMTCRVRAAPGGLEMVCTERDAEGKVRTQGTSPPGTRP